LICLRADWIAPFARQVRREDQRHRVATVDFVLKEGGEGDLVVAEDFRDRREDAGWSLAGEAEVVARLELIEGQHVGRGV
jgi:hypothetical protein